MIDNHAYNLLRQLTEEHTSLWRIKDEYLKDADGCESCKNLWTKLEKDKEEHVKEIESLLKEHLK